MNNTVKMLNEYLDFIKLELQLVGVLDEQLDFGKNNLHVLQKCFSVSFFAKNLTPVFSAI